MSGRSRGKRLPASTDFRASWRWSPQIIIAVFVFEIAILGALVIERHEVQVCADMINFSSNALKADKRLALGGAEGHLMVLVR